MAHETENYPAETGANKIAEINPDLNSQGTSPTWDRLGNNGDLPPFFNPGEEAKRKGFVAVFLCNSPRKETPSKYKPGMNQLWFDIQSDQQTYTWTIDQISLLIELKKHQPLVGKALRVQLVPVDEAFRQRMPRYRGKERYLVEDVTPPGALSLAKEAGSPNQNMVQGPIPAVA
jgi:hypothetical protein